MGHIFTHLNEGQEDDPMPIEGMEGIEKEPQPTDGEQGPGGKDAINVDITNVTLALADVENKSEEGEIDCSHAMEEEGTEREIDCSHAMEEEGTETQMDLTQQSSNGVEGNEDEGYDEELLDYGDDPTTLEHAQMADCNTLKFHHQINVSNLVF
jgi:hypothetical protein